jgi:YesN/AraC family two-component response regulator
MSKVKLHICFVDDETDFLFIVERMFRKEIEKSLCRITTSSNGQECLDMLKTSEGADVVYIFTDINMPEMDGISLLKEVKALYPHIKVFMVSGYSPVDYENQVLEMGADEYFSKPINFEELKKKIFEEEVVSD